METVDDLIELQMHLERETVRKVITDLRAEFAERQSVYYLGFDAGCEEIMCRLQTKWGEKHDH